MLNLPHANYIKSKQNLGTEEMAAYDSLMVFTGNANPALADNVARHLDISLGRASVGKFSDGEIAVELLENVRGRDVLPLPYLILVMHDRTVVRVPFASPFLPNW